MKKILIATGFFVIAVIASFIFTWARPPALNRLKVGEAVFRVEIADNPGEWAMGLSFRDSLPEDRGMLFIFPKPQIQKFWMKDTRMPLDMIWIGSGRVIGIAENAQPETGPSYIIYESPGTADQVLEINGGLAERLGIKIGDSVILE